MPFDRCLFLSWEWMHKWHPVYPAHVAELEFFPGFEPGSQGLGYKKRAQPLDDMCRSVLNIAVSRLKKGCVFSFRIAPLKLNIGAAFDTLPRRRRLMHVDQNPGRKDWHTNIDQSLWPKFTGHTQDFRRSTPDGNPMPTGTSFTHLDVLFDCASPCLMFLRFMVRCAAYAAWTTPSLVMIRTDKTCVKFTCLYQVRVFSKSNKQVCLWMCTFLAFSHILMLLFTFACLDLKCATWSGMKCEKLPANANHNTCATKCEHTVQWNVNKC